MPNCHQIIEALIGTLSPEVDVREQSEKYLKAQQSTGNLLVSLVNVILEKQISDNVRLAAAIYLKNEIRNNWKDKTIKKKTDNTDNKQIYTETEQNAVVSKIFELVKHTLNDITNIFSVCVNIVSLIIVHEFSSNCYMLIEPIYNSLSNDNLEDKLCAITILTRLLKKYELHCNNVNKSGIIELVETCCPKIMEIIASSNGNFFVSIESTYFVKNTIKIYSMLINMMINKTDYMFNTMDNWLQMISLVVKAEDPAYNNDEKTIKYITLISKAKKWALTCYVRLIFKFSKSNKLLNLSSKAASNYCQRYIDYWSVNFLNDAIIILSKNSVSNQINNSFESDIEEVWKKKHVCLLLEYLTISIELSSTYKYLKSHIKTLISDIIIKFYTYTDADIELRKEDPDEFLRLKTMIFYESIEPIEYSNSFFSNLLKYRGKNNIDMIMLFIFDNLKALISLDVRKIGSYESKCKFVFFSILKEILPRLFKLTHIEAESILYYYLLPEMDLNNEDIFTRGCACELFGRLFDEKININLTKNKIMDTNKFIECVKILLYNCNDNDSYVKTLAIEAVPNILNIKNVETQDFIIKNIESIITILLSGISSPYTTSSSIIALEHIVNSYPDYMADYGYKLAQTLVMSFYKEKERYKNIEANNDNYYDYDQYDMHARTILSICNTLSSIIECMTSNEKYENNIYDLYIIIKPILDISFNKASESYIESIAILLSIITYKLNPLPEDLWQYFDNIFEAICGDDKETGIVVENYAEEEIGLFIAALDNYIKNGKEVFINGISKKFNKPYIDMYIKIAEKSINKSYDYDGPMDGLLLFWFLADHFSQTSSVLLKSSDIIFGNILQLFHNNYVDINKSISNVIMLILSTHLYAIPEKTIAFIGTNKDIYDIFFDTCNLINEEARKAYIISTIKFLSLVFSNKLEIQPNIRSQLDKLVLSLYTQIKALVKQRDGKKNVAIDIDSSIESNNIHEFDESDNIYLNNDIIANSHEYIDDDNGHTDSIDDYVDYYDYTHKVGERSVPFEYINEYECLGNFLNNYAGYVEMILGPHKAEMIDLINSQLVKA